MHLSTCTGMSMTDVAKLIAMRGLPKHFLSQNAYLQRAMWAEAGQIIFNSLAKQVTYGHNLVFVLIPQVFQDTDYMPGFVGSLAKNAEEFRNLFW